MRARPVVMGNVGRLCQQRYDAGDVVPRIEQAYCFECNSEEMFRAVNIT